MSDHGETYQRVSVPEAAAILGLSVATVRRMIRDGRLRSETVSRPQGIAYVVVLPIDRADHSERSSAAHQVGTTARLNESPADAMAALIQATLTPVLAPIVAELAATRQAGEQKDATIRDQAETIGRLGAELEAERAAHRGVGSGSDRRRLLRNLIGTRHLTAPVELALLVILLLVVLLVAVAVARWVR